MYKDKFVLSVIHDEYPVREFGERENKRVALPFNSEYKIRLKNKNSKGCTARVFIDDKKATMLGDLIISAGTSVNLERFIDNSLEVGKKFKFVSLMDPNVDDPTSSGNGIIRVEFRLAKKENGIKINVEPFTYKPWNWDDWQFTKPYKPWDCGGWKFRGSYNPWAGSSGDLVVYNSDFHSDGSYDGSVQMSFSSNFVSDNMNSLEDGATIEGGHSNQSFVYSNLDVEDFATILQLKIVGIKDSKQADKLIYQYCSKCGSKAKRTDRFCSECGNKL